MFRNDAISQYYYIKKNTKTYLKDQQNAYKRKALLYSSKNVIANRKRDMLFTLGIREP